jgi:hypothetical protein
MVVELGMNMESPADVRVAARLRTSSDNVLAAHVYGK